MSHSAEMASLRVQKLLNLTQGLTDRLQNEMELIKAHRAAEMAQGMAETAELANQYRRESAQIKANPAIIAEASLTEKKALIAATETFDEVLARHSEAVEAARHISEGLVRSIASEVAGARAMGTGYGSSGLASQGDSRAVALNRMA